MVLEPLCKFPAIVVALPGQINLRKKRPKVTEPRSNEQDKPGNLPHFKPGPDWPGSKRHKRSPLDRLFAVQMATLRLIR
jgi:hypothetical protein